MKKIISHIVLILSCFGSAGQGCDEPAGLLSLYYLHSTNKSGGLGLEAGFLHEQSPVGFYLGCNYIRYASVKAGEPTGDTPSEQINFYCKLTGRIVRVENKFSAFLVASPVLSFRSVLDFQTGVKLLAPLSERIALQIEPLYMVRPRACQVNFHFTVVL